MHQLIKTCSAQKKNYYPKKQGKPINCTWPVNSYFPGSSYRKAAHSLAEKWTGFSFLSGSMCRWCLDRAFPYLNLNRLFLFRPILCHKYPGHPDELLPEPTMQRFRAGSQKAEHCRQTQEPPRIEGCHWVSTVAVDSRIVSYLYPKWGEPPILRQYQIHSQNN